MKQSPQKDKSDSPSGQSTPSSGQSTPRKEPWHKAEWWQSWGKNIAIGAGVVVIGGGIASAAVFISGGFSSLRDEIHKEATEIRKELTAQGTEIRKSLSETNVNVGKLEGNISGINDKLDLFIRIWQSSNSYPPPLYAEREENEDWYPTR